MSTVEKSIRLYAWRANYHVFDIVQDEVLSRHFNIQLMEATTPVDLTDCRVYFHVDKPDSTAVYVECEVKDAADGQIRVTLTNQMAACDGLANCFIQVVSLSNTDLRFDGLKLNVKECNLNDSAESSNEFSALVEALNEVRPATERADAATAAANKATSDANTATTQANTARDNANQATQEATAAKNATVEATNKANTATANANQAAQTANQAAQNADNSAANATEATNRAIELGKAFVEELPFVTPQMYGAKGDGSQNDTSAIQAALDNSSFVFIPDGVYLVDGHYKNWGDVRNGGLKPKSNQTIVLSDNAVLKCYRNISGFYHIFNVCAVENVTIRGGKIEGIKCKSNDPNYDGAEKNTMTDAELDAYCNTNFGLSLGFGSEFGAGIDINGSRHVTVENVDIYNCWGDSICVGHAGEVNSYDVNIYNCILHDSRRQGLSVVGCEYCVVRDCEIYNIRGIAPQYGIDIEPDGDYGVAKNIVIDGCYIHDNAVGSIVVADVSRNEITNVRITNCTLNDVNCVGGSVVSGVEVSNCDIVIAYFGGVNPVRVSDCRIGNVYLYGGTVFLDNCDVIGKPNGEYLIDATKDRYPARRGNLTFYNCRFYSNSTSKYVIFTANGDTTNGNLMDRLVFESCYFELGTSCYFSYVLSCNHVIFNGCRFKYLWNVYELFTLNGNNQIHFVANGVEVECPNKPNAVLKIGNETTRTVEISNCKFPNTAVFTEVQSGASGTIYMVNTKVANTTIKNSNTFEVFVSNSIDTSPVEGSTNLITSGAVAAVEKKIPTKVSELSNDKNYITLADLPKYDGGVS